jgi:hypothetical protein
VADNGNGEKRRASDSLSRQALRVSPFAALALATLGGALKLGGDIANNTNALKSLAHGQRVLATHVCRIEERQHIAAYADCMIDFTLDSPVHLEGEPTP